MAEFLRLPLDVIHPSPLQMRLGMDAEALEELAESLRRDGQQRPIKVRPHPSRAGEYEIVYGHRTYEAAKLAGLSELDAIVEEMSDEEVMWAQWAENEYREALCDYDRARWLKKMIDEYGYSTRELADKLRKSQPWVVYHLKMLELEEVITRVITSRDFDISPVEVMRKLSERQARAIRSAPERYQEALVEHVVFAIQHGLEPPSAHALEEMWKLWEKAENYSKLLEDESESLEEELEEVYKKEEAPQPSMEELELQREPTPHKEHEVSPREFIEETFRRWPGATEEFIIHSLKSKFGLSDIEAWNELHAYYKSRQGPTKPKTSTSRENAVCPLCCQRVPALDLQARIEELLYTMAEKPLGEWIKEAIGHD